VSSPVFVCAGYSIVQRVNAKPVLDYPSIPNLLSFIVYHELESLPFSDFEYGGNVKPAHNVQPVFSIFLVYACIFILNLDEK
jgi:hypothetical protein